MSRILVGQFMFEANSFSAGTTRTADFGELTPSAADLAGRAGELGAACRALLDRGHELVPSVAAVCGPGPVLDDAVVSTVIERSVAAVEEGVVGCYFALHGAAASESDADPEGTLLTALRKALGDRPLAISLDLHAQLTTAMTRAVDAVATYRTSPHIDIADTGERAATLLADALEGRTSPVVAMADCPMITPADTHDSQVEGPYRRLMELCRVVEGRGALAAGLCTTQPWLDIPEFGWRAVVTTDADRPLAAALAAEIAAAAWSVRNELRGGACPSVEEALELALAGPAPCVVSEASDSTNAGALGDSTEMLRAALPHSGRRIYLSTRDAVAAAAAFEAGEGSTTVLEVGRGAPGAYNAPVRLEAVVERLFDDEYVHTSPVVPGLTERPGPTALLRIGELRLVVHSRRTLLIDPVLFEALGLDPTAAEIVQAKSPVSFRAGFARVAERMIVADGSGPACGRLERLPFTRRPRPLFPFEDVDVA